MSLIPNMKFRYIGALLAMALLLSMAMVVMQYLLHQQSQDARVINLAGMQRMLSQRIALFSSIDSPQGLETLRLAIDDFEGNHHFLTEKEGGQYHHLNESLESLYYENPIQLHQQSLTFITLAKRHLKQPNTQLSEGILTLSQTLLPNLNQAVSLFEHQAKLNTERVRKIELLIWLLGLTVLFIEAKFVFRPMTKEITEAFRQLEASKKLADDALQSKSRFLARVSHELRTPLQALHGYLDEFIKSADAKQLEHVKSAANQLDILLYSVEDFNSLSQQDIVIERHQIQLHDVIKTACISFQLSAHNKSLTFNLALGNALNMACFGDAKRIAWLVGELVNNAIKFTERGGIQVFADIVMTQEASYLEFIVEDTGEGFDYKRLQESMRTEHFQGSQLGLQRCQLLVSALGGQLKFTARKPFGTRAELQIPVEVDIENVRSSKREKLSTNVLLVEDNLINARVIEKMLQPIAKQVTHAEHGEQALEIYQVGKFDVVLMDLNMPIMNGFEATRKIRAIDPIIPILVVTANTNSADLDKVYELGATAHLYKPLQTEVLTDKLTAMLDKR
ncbi:response regulator [Pseudoalteromonas sp. McH1-7]|uniref:response regulator n=1 Tax=unclassified Pseudoalteromonas TaxID=194690 RepID=UPI001590CFCA|nr:MULTISPECIES: response regulator [unclassified Pseudoalteromonas]NUZ12163.1 response regulator [Pseudoalteromonas sp. McH1-7]USD28763.1 response regulator [Pseudoalteromonas sp. SCSIO 43201]